MSDVPVWRFFAYMDKDPEGDLDESRTLNDWQLADVLRWAQTRGYDNIYFARTDKTTTFQRPGPVGVVHHFGGSDGVDQSEEGRAA